MKSYLRILRGRYFGLIIIVTIILSYYTYTIIKKYNLENSKSFIEGRLTKFYTARGMSLGVVYVYKIGDKEYLGKGNINLNREQIELWNCLLLNQKYLVVYQTRNCENSEILLSSSDYERHNTVIPEIYKSTVFYIDSILNNLTPFNKPVNNCM